MTPRGRLSSSVPRQNTPLSDGNMQSKSVNAKSMYNTQTNYPEGWEVTVWPLGLSEYCITVNSARVRSFPHEV